MTFPIVLADEFGYLANAAYFTGLDWSEIVRGTAYYGFGYSLFLIPFFALMSDPAAIYQGALWVNSVAASSVIFPAYYMAKRLAPKQRRSVHLLVAVTVSCYPSYLIYSNLAWAESMFVGAYWLLVAIFLHINNRVGLVPPFFAGILASFLYMVHPRGLAIVAAGVITLTLCRFLLAVEIRQILAFGAGAAPVVILQALVGGYLRTALWQNDVAENTLFSMGERAISVLDPNGWYGLLLVGLGQILYLGAASYMFLFVGSWALGRKLFETWKSKSFSSSKGGPLSEDSTVGLVFAGVSFVASFLLSVLFETTGTRADQLIFGRYNEAVAGPILLIGLVAVVGTESRQRHVNAAKLWIWILVYGLIAGVALTMGFQEELDSRPKPVMLNITGLFPYKTAEWRLYIPGLLGNVGLMTGAVSFLLLWRKRVAIGGLLLIFIWVHSFVVSEHLEPAAQHRARVTKISSWLKANEVGPAVYFLRHLGESGCSVQRFIYQFQLADRRIIPIFAVDEVDRGTSSLLITCGRKEAGLPEAANLLVGEPRRKLLLWALAGESGSGGKHSGGSVFQSKLAEGPLPVEAYRSTIELFEPERREILLSIQYVRWLHRITWPRILRRFRGIKGAWVQVRNESSFRWPQNVKVGIIWFATGRGGRRKVNEGRVRFPNTMEPGSRQWLWIPLEPWGPNGSVLPPGRYEVWVSVVEEGVSWFHPEGNDPLRLNVVLR